MHLVSPRSLGSGVLCAAGAVLAHGLAGGAVTWGPPLALLLPMSVLVCAVVLRRSADPAALAAAALATQLGWHASLMLAAGHGPEAGSAPLPMLGAHLLVAAASVVAALGAERAAATLLLGLIAAVVRGLALRRLPRPGGPVITASVPARVAGRLRLAPRPAGCVPVGRRAPPLWAPTAS